MPSRSLGVRQIRRFWISRGARLGGNDIHLVVKARQISPDSVEPTPYFVKYAENSWAAVKGYLDAVTAAAAPPVIERYTGMLAAMDVFTESTAFWVMESVRLDRGYGSQVHL